MSKKYVWTIHPDASDEIFSNIETEIRSMFGNIKKETGNNLTVLYPFSAIFGKDKITTIDPFIGVCKKNDTESCIIFVTGHLPPQEGTQFYYTWDRYYTDIVSVITSKVGKPAD